MRSVPWIIGYVGIAIALAVGLGSLVAHRLERRDRQRRVSGIHDDNVSPGAPSDEALLDIDWTARALEAGAVVLWSWLVVSVIDWLAPGSETFRSNSAFGFLASRALTAWESAGLWAALGVLGGLLFPLPWYGDARRRTPGRDGSIAAGAAVLWFLPLTGLASAMVFFGVQILTRRTDRARLAALLTLPSAEWLQSITEFDRGFGLVHGPETALWAVLVAALLGVSRLRPASEPGRAPAQ